MQKSTLEVIHQRHAQFPDSKGTPIESADEIKAVESKLGVKFSNEYREFLRVFGGCDVGRRTVYGIRLPPRFLGATQYRTENDRFHLVDKATVYYRTEKWPGVASWYIISTDYSGNPIGIAPDGSVWISDHNQMMAERINNDFEEWVIQDCFAVEDEVEELDEN